MGDIDVSVVLPCLNEEETIGICIQKALDAFKDLGLVGEVIVSDNGSTDNSSEIAKKLEAKVVYQPEKGYGNAYLKGLSEARGKFIVMADSDNTYDLAELNKLIEPLKQGYDLAIGSRFKGKILPGAMTFSHRYIGNPILTGFLNLFFSARISDAHSGFRAISKEAFQRLDLRTGGMEFASEMIIEALRAKLKIFEAPINYYPRQGKSKLESLPDAWRHMRFMLIFSPTYLFLIPGFLLFGLGFLFLILSAWGKFTLFNHRFDIHAMVFSSAFCLLGFQVINFGLFAKTYAVLSGFQEENLLLKNFYRYFKLEKGILLGSILFFIGLVLTAYIIYQWSKTGFEALNALKLAIFMLTFMIMGIQTVFSSFFLSLLSVEKRKRG